ncbi:MAG: substrate-binding domain-containing protein [Roseiflexaceae bacterium]|nr:substrate-binding domain-containing protein [Roseiflexus sp.]MDW8212445.1 substrate-binding domain-containing protein [Roseiflexaceae bacterium]
MTSAITLGCVLNDARFTFWSILRHGARARAAEHGVKIIDQDAQTVETQVEMVADLLRQRVHALILGPVHETRAFAQHLELARLARVPVIEVDGGILEGYVSATVRSDERQGLMRIAELLTARLGDQFRIALIAGPRNHRAEILTEALRRWPRVQIVAQAVGDWTRESGRRLTEEWLRSGQPIDAIFAANDPMALGAADALETLHPAQTVVVTGFDGLPEALRAIYSNRMLATVNQDPLCIGRQAVDAALQALRGAPVERQILTPGELITRDNVTESALRALDLLPGIMRDLIESNAERQKLQEEIIAAQRSTIRELSTPIIPIDERTLIVPLIGAIDSARATQMTQAVLEAIGERHADDVIIDITGIAAIDTGVANHLVQTAQAASLLGAHVTLAGMSPEVAQTIVQLGVRLGQLTACSNLQAALELARRRRRR